MKLLVVFLCVLSTGLVVVTRADSEECDDRATECVANMVIALMGETNTEKLCSDLRSSYLCFRDLAENCADDDEQEDLENSLETLDKVLKENCGENTKEEDQCVKDNEEYLYECVGLSLMEVLEAITSQGDANPMDEDTLKCSMFHSTAGCLLRRTEEKCGAEARKKAEEELKNAPEEIRNACMSANTLEFATNSLEELRKRKKK